MDLKKSLKSLTWLNQQFQKSQSQKSRTEAKLLFLGEGEKLTARELQSIPSFTRKQIENKSSLEFWQTQRENFWLIQPNKNPSGQPKGAPPPKYQKKTSLMTENPGMSLRVKNHYGLFNASVYSMARDIVGTCFHQILNKGIQSLEVEYREKTRMN